MNYWLAGPCRLWETEKPLFDMLENMRENGRITANVMYGFHGFTCHHNTDGFYDTAPQSHAIGAAIWPMTAPWLATHIWEYYQYHRDKDVLSEHYSLIKEIVEFYEDYLFEYKVFLVTGPSVSPENKFRLDSGIEGSVCLSPTIDNQILNYFFDSCLKIAQILGDKSDFIDRVSYMKSKLPKTRIGKHHQIMEWIEDYDEVEKSHRHISPLFGLYPGIDIDLGKTPELAEAALVTIQRRLSNSHYISQKERESAIENWQGVGIVKNARTGWSAAWLIHFLARLGRGDEAFKEIVGILDNLMLPNLLCDHPPFQIDGNLGMVSGICELLVQSTEDRIKIFPALPSVFCNGEIKNMGTKTGCIVSLKWENYCITYLKISGQISNKVRVIIPKQYINTRETFDKVISINYSEQILI